MRCGAALVDEIDWDCAVVKNYSDANLGCKRRVASGLDWVFQNAPEAIILEDDCLPGASFFPYCEALLDRYRQDERVMHIGGKQLRHRRKEFGPTLVWILELRAGVGLGDMAQGLATL